MKNENQETPTQKDPNTENTDSQGGTHPTDNDQKQIDDDYAAQLREEAQQRREEAE